MANGIHIYEARENKKTGGFQLTIHIVEGGVCRSVTRHVNQHMYGLTYNQANIDANTSATSSKDSAAKAVESAKAEVKRLEALGKNITDNDARKANLAAVVKAKKAQVDAEAKLRSAEEALSKVREEKPLQIKYVSF